jgi:hypothetical protein
MPVRASLPSPQALLGLLGQRPPVAPVAGGRARKAVAAPGDLVLWAVMHWVSSSTVPLATPRESVERLVFPFRLTSDQVGIPAELKHINKRRKRNQPGLPQ